MIDKANARKTEFLLKGSMSIVGVDCKNNPPQLLT